MNDGYDAVFLHLRIYSWVKLPNSYYYCFYLGFSNNKVPKLNLKTFSKVVMFVFVLMA